MFKIICPLVFLSVCGAAQKNFNILDYGAKGDGIASNTKAIQNAVNACAKSGGGTVLIPQGSFVTGSVQLFSDINVCLSAGAKLLGVKDNNEYLHQKDFGFSGMGAGNKTGILFAANAENISVTGHGIIDGQGDFSVYLDSLQQGSDLDNKYARQGTEYMKNKYGTEDGPVMWRGAYEERPGVMLIFSNCKNVSLSDVTIKESPNWTVAFYKCDGIKVKGITIKNNMLIPNSDGLDFYDSANGLVSDCRIDAGDDAIAIGYSSNISVSNCILHSRSCGIRIGYNGFEDSETRGNLLFNNIRIFDSNRGIGIFQRKKGDMENIHFSNIIIQTRLHSGQWWGHGEPIHISSVPGVGAKESGYIKNVTFSNVTAAAEEGIVLYGYRKGILEGIKFNDVGLTLKNGPLLKPYGGNFDLRPTNDLSLGIFKHEIPAVYANHAKNLCFANFSVNWENGLPDYFTNVIFSENFENLFIRDFFGNANPTIKAPAIFLKNGKGFYFNNIAGPTSIEKHNVKP